MNDDIDSLLFLMFGIISGVGLFLFGLDKVIYRYVLDIWRELMDKLSNTQQTQPTDSQMLDFLIDNGAYINAFHVFNGFIVTLFTLMI